MTFLRHITLYFLFCLFILPATFAQTNAIVNQHKTKEEEELNSLLKKGEEFLSSNLKGSEIIFKQALIQAQKLGLKQEESNAYHDLGKLYSAKNDIVAAKSYFEKAIIIREEIKDYEGLSKSLNQVGIILQDWGKLDSALVMYKNSYRNAEQAGYTRGMAIAIKQEGNVFARKAQYNLAIERYMKALNLFEQIKSDDGILSTYNNIGGIYATLLKRKDALVYFRKSLTLAKKTSNFKEIGNACNTIATIYLRKDTTSIRNEFYNLDSGTIYLKQASTFFRKANYQLGIAQCYHNLALVYYENGRFKDALIQSDSALSIAKEIDDKYELINNHVTIGQCHAKMGNYDESMKNMYTALDIALEAKLNESRLAVYDWISQINAKFFKFDLAYSYLKAFTKLQDTLRNDQTQKIVQEMETKYQTAKKEQLIKEGELKNEAQRKQLFFVLGALILFVLIALFAFWQYLQKRKANNQLTVQNIEISRQRDLIEDQQKGIMDSIHYASRIQQAILPNEDYLDTFLGKNYFILFKPRDIVSGDFYWIGTRNNKKIIVAADCTGHGVPGAFMSMLGTAFLNEITNLHNEGLNAALILNELRDYVISSLKQTGKKGEQKDGMDVSMYIYDEKTKMIEYAGANNPLFIVRKNPERFENWTEGRFSQEIFETEDGNGCALIHIKADKMPIGIYSETYPFENVYFQLQEGDVLFNFSDGYVDQFGGPKNQKFLTKRFKKLLTNINQLPIKDQYTKINDAIEDWKSGYEQIDDILVIGFKV